LILIQRRKAASIFADQEIGVPGLFMSGIQRSSGAFWADESDMQHFFLKCPNQGKPEPMRVLFSP